jgi:ribosomal protein S18 acetylase RimI-like enzyme
MNPDAVAIRPIALGDVVALRDCVDAVMRERHYLAYQEPFSVEETRAFVARNMRERNPHWVASQGFRIVGWCDIRRDSIPVHTHCATLGMGVLDAYRGRGLGERLIRAALEDARVQGFERVELSVYAKNARAHSLYRKIGFLHEGMRIRGKKLDGEYDDVHMLVYFL